MKVVFQLSHALRHPMLGTVGAPTGNCAIITHQRFQLFRLVNCDYKIPDKLCMDQMIPMSAEPKTDYPEESMWEPRLFVGHNVSYDRTFVRDQYYIDGPKTRCVLSFRNLLQTYYIT